jgi:2-polyprenyl-3-methyl-5-hydroxy-6-metoxy-1,4-benzoquinol methylase
MVFLGKGESGYAGDFLFACLAAREKRVSRQAIFETVYRGRQSFLHHCAYMRMGKVLLARRILRLAGIGLTQKDIFDYGFGAGTFYRYCPTSAPLRGVEQDPVVCQEVTQMLAGRGHRQVELQSIEIECWKDHPLLQKAYDVFLCSHVLEHLPDPVDFLRTVRPCVKPDGVFLGLVPINERASNPHHLQVVDRSVVESWAADAGYEVAYYEENDPFLYWAQPLYTVTSGWKHKLAQAMSLDLGLSATLVGERLWFAWGKVFGKLTFSKPTQAAFVLRPRTKAAAGGG